MSSYASRAEVREVIVDTLRMEGRDPRDYNLSGILRDAFYPRGTGYGWGWHPPEVWRAAVDRNRRS
jgi:hypothetical protein